MADSLFVFLEKATLFDTAPCVVINGNNQIIEAYQERSITELQTLAKTHKLIIVLPCHIINSQIVRLPTLKNAALMLPNILEESLIEPIENIHFVLSKAAVNQESYVCHYISKSFCESLLETLMTLELEPHLITNDLVIDENNLLLVGRNYFQIKSENTIGSLTQAGLTNTMVNTLSDCKCFTFLDSSEVLLKALNISASTAISTTYHEHIARELLKQNPTNLLQGTYEKKTVNQNARKLLTWPLVLLSMSIFAFSHFLQYQNLNHAVMSLKKQNLAYYQTIFPEAKQMISPRFRVEQWLTQHQAAPLPPILAILQEISPKLSLSNTLKMLSIQGQNNLVTLVFQIANFDELNQLKKQIEERGVQVEQVNTQSENNLINAIWKLSK